MSKTPIKRFPMSSGSRQPITISNTNNTNNTNNNNNIPTTKSTATVPKGTKNRLRQDIVEPKLTKVTTKITPQLNILTPKLLIENTRESLLKQYVPKNIDSSDIQSILDLKYADGNDIINENDKDVIIEVIGMLYIYDVDYILNFLEEAPNKGWIFWEHKFMNIGKVSIEREILINRAEEVGVKDVGKCRYCPSKELVFAQKQVSSGDEPMRVYVKCVLCNKHWQQG
jgi:DNA-directed RNA polymerase subunit M/transcription elongation factor TFIIS